MREILEQMGLGKSHLHISESGLFDYSKVPYEVGRRNPRKCKTPMPLEESLSIIPDNSFAVGHLIYTKETELLLKDFNTIFIGRDIKEVYLSFMIYQLETGRSKRYPEDRPWDTDTNPTKQFLKFLEIRGDKLMTKYFTKILPWTERKIPCFDYNEMQTNPLIETKWLAALLDKKFSDDEIRSIVANSFGKETQTLSKKKDRSTYWSALAHQKIEALIKKYKVRYPE